MKFKKDGKRLILIYFILSLLVSYLLYAFLYQIKLKLNLSLADALMQPKEMFHVLVADENLKMIIPFIPIILFVVALYVFRKNIFDADFEDASDFGVKGTAKWGNPSEMMDGKILSKYSKFSEKTFKKGLKMEEGIVVGRIPNQKKALIIHKETNLETMNVYVNGPSGSGKGQSYVFTNLVNIRNENIIVIDPKGENYNITAQLKRDQGYKVYSIDFAEFSSARYNPLDYVRNDEDAQKISMIMAKNSTEDGKQDFFAERAQKLLAALMSYVKSVYPKEKANMEKLIEVYNAYVSDEKICSEWLYTIPENNPAKGLLEGVLTKLESKTRSSVLASLDSILGEFQQNRVKHMTATSDFTFDEFQKQKSVLYVKIKVPTNPNPALTSVFFSQMIDRFFELGDRNGKAKGVPELDIPVHFLLDEFPNIGRIEGYENTLSLCRGYKIYMHTIVQDISQIQDKKMYGPEATKTIISNHSAILILKVGEKEGAKYWSDWLENTTVKYKSESKSISRQGKTTNISDVIEGRALLPANELMAMEKDRAYLILKGQNPLKVEKAWQFKLFPNLLFNKKQQPNYNENREKLGYTTAPVEDVESEDNIVYFEEYQKNQYQKDITTEVSEEINKKVNITIEDEKEFKEVRSKAEKEETKKDLNSISEEVDRDIEEQEKQQNIIGKNIADDLFDTQELNDIDSLIDKTN